MVVQFGTFQQDIQRGESRRAIGERPSRRGRAKQALEEKKRLFAEDLAELGGFLREDCGPDEDFSREFLVVRAAYRAAEILVAVAPSNQSEEIYAALIQDLLSYFYLAESAGVMEGDGLDAEDLLNFLKQLSWYAPGERASFLGFVVETLSEFFRLLEEVGAIADASVSIDALQRSAVISGKIGVGAGGEPQFSPWPPNGSASSS